MTTCTCRYSQQDSIYSVQHRKLYTGEGILSVASEKTARNLLTTQIDLLMAMKRTREPGDIGRNVEEGVRGKGEGGGYKLEHPHSLGPDIETSDAELAVIKVADKRKNATFQSREDTVAKPDNRDATILRFLSTGAWNDISLPEERDPGRGAGATAELLGISEVTSLSDVTWADIEAMEATNTAGNTKPS
mmetsp:Transcript_35695/g.72755  ORF Transcript_35695/g.72755 Transcript_35695/m.72755 type:complete len:190 (+) Transcript_35695:22-591(+)